MLLSSSIKIRKFIKMSSYIYCAKVILKPVFISLKFTMISTITFYNFNFRTSIIDTLNNCRTIEIKVLCTD